MLVEFFVKKMVIPNSERNNNLNVKVPDRETFKNWTTLLSQQPIATFSQAQEKGQKSPLCREKLSKITSIHLGN